MKIDEFFTQSHGKTPGDSVMSGETFTAHQMVEFAKQWSSKNKKEKAADECYAAFVAAWAEGYPILVRGFRAVDGKAIKDLINKTRTHVIGSSKTPEKELMVNTFKYVIAYVKREHHFCDGKPLTTWNSQYLSIIHEISNGKQTGQKQSVYGWAANL